MATYKTPGVYVEEIPKLPPSIAEVATAIPAFIGYTERAGKLGSALPTQTIGGKVISEAVRITSLLDYETYFGKSVNETLAISVNESYAGATVTPANAGTLSSRTVSVSLTASVHTLYYHMQMYFGNGGGPCYVISVGLQSATLDKDVLKAGLDMAKQYDEPTLLVVPEAAALSQADAGGVYLSALQQAALLQDRFVIMDVCAKNSSNSTELLAFKTAIGNDNLKYGAAYYPFLNTTLGYVYDLNDGAKTTITLRKDMNNDGDYSDVAGTAPADAITTPTFAQLTSEVQGLILKELSKLSVTLSPSASIAGVYAAVDSSRGVWKAPANVSLAMVTDVTDMVNDLGQASYNVDADFGKSVNVIRKFTGKGILVWGARTLAGNDNEWRYVSVRRFFNMVEESTKKATAAFVFESNDANTWVKVQGMIENYLTQLWSAGALQGAKAEDAFYVSVGLGKTMTAQDILEGRMYVEIGMAVVRPAEFIVLKFSHKLAES